MWEIALYLRSKLFSMLYPGCRSATQTVRQLPFPACCPDMPIEFPFPFGVELTTEQLIAQIRAREAEDKALAEQQASEREHRARVVARQRLIEENHIRQSCRCD